MENINVLSLFDGMSCGQQALERVGIKVNNYFASEIDKYAIQVTQKNFPNTIQLGSVLDLDGYKLPKIDLLMGGSPCQSFSFAGKRKGMSTKCETEILTLEHYLQLKSEGYEFEGQSYLFWEYMRILNEVKPKYFLLENVEMGEKWEKILSKAIGVNGIHINSALVSAQNRKRIYWTNIGMQPMGLFGYPESIIQQPKDKGILLKDILQDNPNAKYYISSKMEEHLKSRDSIKIKNGQDKSGTITTNGEGKQGNNSTFICQEIEEKYFLSEKMIAGFERHKERHNDKGTGFGYIPKTETDKENSLRANAALCPTDNMLIVHNLMPRSSTTGKGGTGHLSRNDGKTYCLDTGNTNAVEIVAMRGRTENKGQDWHNSNHIQKLESRNDGKTNSITGVTKDNLVREVKQISNNNKSNGGTQPYQQDRIYDINGISPALQAQLPKGSTMINTSRIRRLTPIECERLQTVADNYTAHVSDSQRYRMLGNGWTIDVICHILSYIK
jgi:DNA (cytosine-5)-methyltransferase 3A